MALNIGFLLFPKVQLLDLVGPSDVMGALRGTKLHFVWKNLEPVSCSTGLALAPNADFASCPQLDIICVPGGAGINALLEDAETIDFVKQQAERARYVTSVCTGALLLGAAGLLRGRKATEAEGRVVQDGNLITAGGITAGIDFGLTIVAELAGSEEAETIQLGLEYSPEPPFDAGTPKKASASVLAAARQRGEASRQAREAILARIAP